MSLKSFYKDRGVQCCLTCMYCDQYTNNVQDIGKEPIGKNGTIICGITDDVMPAYFVCNKYKQCSEEQTTYAEIYDKKTKNCILNFYNISKIKQNLNISI